MLTSVYIDEQAPTLDLLFEQSRNAVTAANAEKGRQLDSCTAFKRGLFDHFVGSDEERCRNG